MNEALSAVRSRDALLDRLVEEENQISFWQASQQVTLAALDCHVLPSERRADGVNKKWVREEVACALRLSSEGAAFRLAVAGEAVNRMPDALQLLRAGEITIRHLYALTDAAAPLTDAEVVQLLDRVLVKATTLGINEFRAAVARAVLDIRPESVEDTRKKLVEDRRIRIGHGMQGMSQLSSELPTQDAVDIAARVEQLAQRWSRVAGETRTLEQLRVDAMVHLITRGPDAPAQTGDAVEGAVEGAGAVAKGTSIAVSVCIGLSTLTGLDDAVCELVAEGIPTSLGGGVVSIGAHLARAIAFHPDATWRRLITDDCGRLLDYGRTSYRPPRPLARFVRARDRQCRFPHCTRPAMRCDLDHCTDWQSGGTTCEHNLECLCQRHHYLKHETDWKVTITADGSTRWTSPTGRIFDRPPQTYPIGTTDMDREPDPDDPLFRNLQAPAEQDRQAPEDPPPF